MRVFYSPDYTLAAHAFETTRKAAWIAEALAQRPISGLELANPPPISEEALRLAHTQDYVTAVKTGNPLALAETNWFTWDPGLWTMACASTGGTVAAALDALEHGVAGSLSSGLHHARRDQGNGLCTFNGLAIAAFLALNSGVSSVLILDLDAHCGGGTHSIVGSHEAIRHTDISVAHFDSYIPLGRNTLELVADSARYLPTIEQRLEQLATETCFGLCLYNAGMDPVDGDGMGVGITADLLRQREEMVFGWCRRRGIPIAFVLAGGYLGGGLDQRGLVNLHRLTLEAAVNFRGNI